MESNVHTPAAWTIIALMPCKEYYVGLVTDPYDCIEELKSRYHAGYFHQHRNKGQIRILFRVKGDYTHKIKLFGPQEFLNMLDDYDPLEDAIIQLLS